MRQHLKRSYNQIKLPFIKWAILSIFALLSAFSSSPAFSQITQSTQSNHLNNSNIATNDLDGKNIHISSNFIKEAPISFTSENFDFNLTGSDFLSGSFSNQNELIVLNKNTIGNVNKLIEKTEISGSEGLKKQSSAFFSEVVRRTGKIVSNALNLIGVRYKWGGSSPQNGLDCSGFVQYVFHNSLKINLPRRAVEMSRLGEKITLNDLIASDLVFFNTRRSPFSHVGIYVGKNKFVHAPSTGNTIRVDDIKNPYWMARFNGARRLTL